MRYAYLVVEGPHDVEFVARLLKPHGVKRVQLMAKLDAYWVPLVPVSFPHGGDLLRRVPVPSFFASSNVSIALHAAGGDSKVAPTIKATLASLRGGQPGAVGAILDADSADSPAARFGQLQQALRAQGLPEPPNPGQVAAGSPRCGVFVLPDNQTQGTLEDLLLECAAVNYAGLLAGARTLVASVGPPSAQFQGDDLEEFQKPAGSNKATIASMVGILKPGKAVQVSIQDNRWLEGAALLRPRVQALQQFLSDLMGPF